EAARIANAIQTAAINAAAIVRRRQTSRVRARGSDAAAREPVELAESLFRDLRTEAARYRVGATCLTAGIEATGARGQPPIHVSITRVVPRPRTDEELRTAYALTTREVHVARLLAAGQRSAEIAASLGISVHTVRRHTEQVLHKLGVQSRSAVGAVILEVI